MRRILAPILLLTFLFPSLAYGVTMDDLVTQDEIVYKKSKTPYTGTTTGLFQYTYKDGIRNGPFRVYYKSGRLSEKGNYRDGKKEGPYIRYFPDGNIWIEGTYKDGKEDGLWIGYHQDLFLESPELGRQLSEKGTYKDGKREGYWVFYNSDRTKRLTGMSLGVTVFDEGSGTYKNGKKVSD